MEKIGLKARADSIEGVEGHFDAHFAPLLPLTSVIKGSLCRPTLVKGHDAGMGVIEDENVMAIFIDLLDIVPSLPPIRLKIEGGIREVHAERRLDQGGKRRSRKY